MKKLSLIILGIVAVAALGLFIVNRGTEKITGGERPTVVASFYPLY